MESLESKVVRLYNQENKSTYEIADLVGTYPNKIRRMLKRMGYDLKSRGEAQRTALKNGRSKHPTEGTERPLEQRVKISSGLVSYWDNMQKEEHQRRCSQAKSNWEAMSSEQKEMMRARSIAAIRAAAVDGSKLEKFFEERIQEGGFSVETHKMLIPAEDLEIDLYIPELKTIIEVDGPSHFLPIWGEEKLQKQLNADLRKSGVLLTRGYVIIRVKSLGQETLAKREELISRVIALLNDIKASFPPPSQRFIEVE
jgi:very-short-patch-repair endonuclease